MSAKHLICELFALPKDVILNLIAKKNVFTKRKQYSRILDVPFNKPSFYMEESLLQRSISVFMQTLWG